MASRKSTSNRRSKKAAGSQTNVAGDIQGPAFTGQFQGPVAAGGDAVNMPGLGAIYKPQGPVEQHFGDKYYFNTTKLKSLHQLKSPPSDFIGREDDIRKAMTEFEKGVSIVGLFGMGGVGKTDLALVLADKLRNSFPDAQFLIDMRGTSKPALAPSEAMAQVIHAYDPLAPLPKSQGEIQGLYNSVLQGKKALILLDNVAGREQVEQLLPPTGCCMLITSLHKFALKGMKSIDINVLSPKDARSLLLANAERIGEGADELAKLCGYMPIALRNAAYVLAECINLDVAEYAERLKDARKRLSLVDASFDLSYDLLTPDLQAKWSMLSIFPADFDRDGVAAVWNIDLDTAIEGLGELMRWSLVNFYPSTKPAEERYRLHDMARLYANSRLAPSALLAAQQRHALYYQGILKRADDRLIEGGDSVVLGLKMFDREWANIKAGQAWAESQMDFAAESNGESLSAIQKLCSDYPSVGANVLDLRLYAVEKIRWREVGLACSRQLGNQEAEGAHLSAIGLAYADLGDFCKAIEYHKQALAISREIGNKHGVGAVLGNLGNAYRLLGDVRKAIEYHEKALAIFREIGDKRGEGANLGNLGNAYDDLGDLRNAIKYYEHALAIDHEIGDKRNEGKWLDNLGNSYNSLGDFQKAIEYHEQGLSIAREIGDRQGEGYCLGNLGIAYKNLGDAHKAIEYHEQALSLVREIGDKNGEASALGNLGNAYYSLDDAHRAVEYHEKALAIDREIGNIRAEGNDLANLGSAYFDLGDTLKAIEYCEQQLIITREIGDRRSEAIGSWNLGMIYEKAGNIERAVDMMQVCVEFERDIGHPNAEKDANYLENLRAKMGTK
jgi:tetratricopeptide (TPR) repeat protein